MYYAMEVLMNGDKTLSLNKEWFYLVIEVRTEHIHLSWFSMKLESLDEIGKDWTSYLKCMVSLSGKVLIYSLWVDFL